MKRILLTILAAVATIACAASCSDNLKEGFVDLTTGNQGNGNGGENTEG